MMGTRDGLRVTKHRLLLVEGPSDQAFIQALAQRMGVADALQIIPALGVANLREQLGVLKRLPGYSRVGVDVIGVMRDADTNPSAALASIQDALRANDLAPVTTVGSLSNGDPRTIVFLMPGLNAHGCLEDLCLWAFADTPLFGCVDAYMACLAGVGAEHTNPNRAAKARLQTLLASAPDGELRLEVAVKRASWWPWEHPAFDDVKRFVHLIAQA